MPAKIRCARVRDNIPQRPDGVPNPFDEYLIDDTCDDAWQPCVHRDKNKLYKHPRGDSHRRRGGLASVFV